MKKAHEQMLDRMLKEGADPIEIAYMAIEHTVRMPWKPRSRPDTRTRLILAANFLAGLAMKFGMERALCPIVVGDQSDYDALDHRLERTAMLDHPVGRA